MSDNGEKKLDFPLAAFRAAANSILVEVLPPKTVTEGGIVIPDAHQQERKIGRVLSVPEGNEDSTCPYMEGDFVLYCDGAGKTVTIGSRDDLLILQWFGEIADDILGYWSGADLPSRLKEV